MECPICYSLKIRNRFHPDFVNLRLCGDCGSAFIWPQPSLIELKNLYREDYFCSSKSARVGYEDYHKDKPIIIKTFERRLDEIEKFYTRKGRLLDLGCATGFFLEAAAQRGWEVHGVDISEMATQLAKKRFGERIFNDIFENLPFPENYFDVITGWDYLEHALDPAKIIRLAAKILKVNGLFVLTTPDYGSLVAKSVDDKWMGFKQDHLFYFTRRALKTAFKANGFSLLKIHYAGKYIRARWFISRLGVYSPRLSRILANVFSWLRLPDLTFYFNPLDIMMILARIKK